MYSLHEIKTRGYLPPKRLRRLLFYGFLALGKVFITNMKDIKKLSSLSNTKRRYHRPPRRFEIPQYNKNMKYCTKDERYLRPTMYCNSHAPEIVALAHQLGAYQKSDQEFAEAAFEFAKRKLILEMLPLDGVENTLRRGTGTCLHELSVFVALCRAAGIKARYKLYSMNMIEAWSDTLADDPMVKKWSDAMGYFMIHGEAEAYVDGKWMVCDVGPTPERQAGSNIPITRFGEDSIGIWFSVIPGTIMEVESISFGLNAMMKLVFKVAPATVDNVNANILDQIKLGRKILAEKGEKEYDAEIRKNFKPKFPEPVLKKRHEIIFEK
ncbi:MAG: transglutaminase family protein [Candidatus Thermoplasmatota archaeon]|nr:transglutaminase family protein [Candidatus Thermoplasmatota archaeon]MBS3801236.1 transglutaminase family protein [Candidatus Thermoplasmatota archaeon]